VPQQRAGAWGWGKQNFVIYCDVWGIDSIFYHPLRSPSVMDVDTANSSPLPQAPPRKKERYMQAGSMS
jgi:hypothetical protein